MIKRRAVASAMIKELHNRESISSALEDLLDRVFFFN